MIRIINKRGTGKTKRLLQLAKANNATFVCRDAKSMKLKAHEYGLDGVDIIDYYDALMRGYKPDSSGVFIDELDGFLCSIFGYGGQVKGYSISEDEI